jgi:hypothetical protein
MTATPGARTVSPTHPVPAARPARQNGAANVAKAVAATEAAIGLGYLI